MAECEVKSSEKTLDGLNEVLKMLSADRGEARKLPPVHLWNPTDCGDIGMEIRADGSWWHEGVRIGREKMVRLFSTILKREADGRIYLVTPYEKVIVHVEDAPFLAVRVDVAGEPGPGQSLVFLTNLGDVAIAGPEQPLRVETHEITLAPAPYIEVRGGLEAKLTRPVFYELAGLAVPAPNDVSRLGVWSGGVFFDIGSVSA